MNTFLIRLTTFSLLIVFLSVTLAFAVHDDTESPLLKREYRENKIEYKEGELIVKFKKDVKKAQKQNIHKKYGSKVIKNFLFTDLDHIQLEPDLTVDEALKIYAEDPDVEYTEPNYIIYPDDDIPYDPYFSELWNLQNLGQSGGTSGADIDVLDAWQYKTGHKKIVVAVIDSGIDYTHEDLAVNIWINKSEHKGTAGADDDGNGYIDDIYGIDLYNFHGSENDPMDELGHGTHIAGIIGAVGNNGTGIVGINWDVKIMACRFLGPWGYGWLSGAIGCLEYVKDMYDRGINVVATNNSWGFSTYSQSLYDAINEQRNILFMKSAGNSYSDNDQNSNFSRNYSLPNVITVAATDHNDDKADFSNYGRRTVHVGAPGVDVFSTLPEYTHWGASFYGDLSGTSMASPHVAGLAALLKSWHGSLNWKEIKNLILSSGDSVVALDGITVTGKRINSYKAFDCDDAPFFSVLQYPDEYQIGETTTLSAVSIDCSSSIGPVEAVTSQGEIIELVDNGMGQDMEPGDGIYTAEWTPSLQPETLTFSSPAGTEVILIGSP